MRKTRILEDNGKFYPQFRHWLFGWTYHTEPACDALGGYDLISFGSLQAARDYLNPPIPVVHRAKPAPATEFNPPDAGTHVPSRQPETVRPR